MPGATEQVAIADAALAITDAAFAVFKEVGSRGASYRQDVIRAFQQTWNARYNTAFPASSPARTNNASLFQPLVTDGAYGPATARVLGFLLPLAGGSTLPTLALSLKSWWAVNSVRATNYLNEQRARFIAIRNGTAPASVASLDAQLQNAAQQNVPQVANASQDRASQAVAEATSAADAIRTAANQNLPVSGAQATVSRIESNEAFQVTGQTPQGSVPKWVWIALGVTVLSGGVGYFLYRRSKKKGRK